MMPKRSRPVGAPRSPPALTARSSGRPLGIWGPVLLLVASGTTIAGKTYKSHLDSYDIRDVLAGKGPSPRHEFLFWTDDGDLAGLRYDRWKLAFMEQRGHGFDVWQEPLVPLRLPKLFDLRADPFERADEEGLDYKKWRLDRAFLLVPAQAFVGQWIQSFRDFPPRQKPGSFSLQQVMEKLSNPAGSR